MQCYHGVLYGTTSFVVIQQHCNFPLFVVCSDGDHALCSLSFINIEGLQRIQQLSSMPTAYDTKHAKYDLHRRIKILRKPLQFQVANVREIGVVDALVNIFNEVEAVAHPRKDAEHKSVIFDFEAHSDGQCIVQILHSLFEPAHVHRRQLRVHCVAPIRSPPQIPNGRFCPVFPRHSVVVIAAQNGVDRVTDQMNNHEMLFTVPPRRDECSEFVRVGVSVANAPFHIESVALRRWNCRIGFRRDALFDPVFDECVDDVDVEQRAARFVVRAREQFARLSIEIADE